APCSLWTALCGRLARGYTGGSWDTTRAAAELQDRHDAGGKEGDIVAHDVDALRLVKALWVTSAAHQIARGVFGARRAPKAANEGLGEAHDVHPDHPTLLEERRAARAALRVHVVQEAL